MTAVLKRISTDMMNTILIIGVILLIIEIVFFNGGLIFSLGFSAVLVYFGWKNYKPVWRKVLFWVGAVSFGLTVLSMIAVRFLVLAILFLAVRHYYKTKQHPEKVQVERLDPAWADPPGEPLFTQKFFGRQTTPPHSYPWQDINVHGGLGDRVIDLSETVLPPDESVISIRHFVGNVTIYVPYEVEVMIHHSAVIGRSTIFQFKKTKMLNQMTFYQTPDYQKNKPRVKVITSIFSGDLEVKRI
ncbi:cell wall-active antibiotics response protein LiaF [Halobacillus litoralis]|uniref:cell wall-active antibiotics response protein LiaF n=1 Tax=Halobacillus litoralis TaxID=45668 RepID=UPI001CD6FF70|nr:cell wall-active antibiotics response protein LiaF [Halobacillus litoralis]MCA1020790.1 cell wall-active antibiotics response protein LiaF [Halobacillus litoralis]